MSLRRCLPWTRGSGGCSVLGPNIRRLHKKPKGWLSWLNVSASPPYTHVVQVGDPVLRCRARPVDLDRLASREIQQTFECLKRTITKYSAFGLSAPQIGLPLRIFAIQFTDEQLSFFKEDTIREKKITTFPLQIIVNPQLKVTQTETIVDIEGCCSVNEFCAKVPRATEVEICGYTDRGQPFTERITGWKSRIVQHEMDHLDGILFTDKMLSDTLFFKYWHVVNARRGNFSLAFGGVNNWKKYLFPKSILKQ